MVSQAATQSRKRRLDSEQQADSTQHRIPRKFRYHPRFWDSLSQVRLTRRALKELDRRRKQEAVTVLANTVSLLHTRRLAQASIRPSPSEETCK